MLMPLLELPDVADALDEARTAVDRVLADRSLRRTGGRVAAEAGLRCARASAALDGTDAPLEQVRAGTVTDVVVQGSLRVAEALPGLVETWTRAPGLAIGRLHVLAAHGIETDETLGRPVEGGPRLTALLDLIAEPDPGPGLLHASIVHAELLTLAPFRSANGVLARAAGRLTLAARGVDPRLLIAVDAGHLARAPEYQGAAGAYATGTRDGLRSWLRHYASAVSAGAAETAEICTSLT